MVAVLLFFVLPYDMKPSTPEERAPRKLCQIDWPGAVLSLAASVILLFALEEGGVIYAWGSAPIIATLAASGACWIFFGFWEAYLTPKKRRRVMLPIFPLRLATHRVIAASLM